LNGHPQPGTLQPRRKSKCLSVQQPVTAAPVIEIAADGTVTITCATPGASIGYRLGKSRNWHVYAGPFKAREAVHAQAIRLGYKVSKEISQ